MAQQVAIDMEKVFSEAASQAGTMLNRCMFLAGRVSQLEAELAVLQDEIDRLMIAKVEQE